MGAQGTATLNFGAFPGAPEASVDVTGQSGFVATSLVEAWLLPIATADHGVDDHVLTKENIEIIAHWKVDGTFTIRAVVRTIPTLRTAIYGRTAPDYGPGANAAERLKLFGQYTVGWVWI